MSPACAHAGAWVAPEGGQQIWTGVVGQRDEQPYYETSVYLEAPIGEGANSLVASPWLKQSYETVEGWTGEAVVGLKRVLLTDTDTAIAVQAGALWVSQSGEFCSEGGAEFRVLAGRSFGETGRSFLNIEAAQRALGGGCTGQKLEVTGGYHAGPHWLGLAQLFIDSPDQGDQSVKAQLTMVRLGGDGRRGIQFGVRARLDGDELEPALVLGFWGRPGD